ncbi:class I SAM-dependent methyltransferase [Micromonospora antibiotica]|uniref:Class I SAM-dependent methyltransferase n=1 Tax=Micromonospora antibiotica TaxID=2807623 RepID=A0ABS3V5C6_9ACTN|nr:class I SAM-dependent methyltransferase [Micromonospora antibiotica]MBO4160742.1 class I SAM-dependent methyltransferase [Micromonospora antibiotica]
MAELFGEVAGDYDEIRPGYPAALAATILAYHGGPPTRLVEVGAGTGLATSLLRDLAAAAAGPARPAPGVVGPGVVGPGSTGPSRPGPVGAGRTDVDRAAPGRTRVTCVEPDARMAAVLAARFPDVEVVVARFEQWSPPPAGVPLLSCALAWHWLDPATRNRRAHDALTPGGTLAVFAHRYDYVDPAQSAAIRAAFESVDPVPHHDQPEDWFHADITGSGLFTDVRSTAFRRAVPLTTAQYQRLVGTFSPQLRRPPRQRERVLTAIGAAVDGFGGTVTLDLRTTLVLARRPA